MLVDANKCWNIALAFSLVLTPAISSVATPANAAPRPAAQQEPQNTQPSQAPDNSAQNKGQTDTADKQGNSPADLELAKKIRKSIMDDKTLSTYGKNVKVIVREGSVTLRGPVRSDDEKKEIGDLASQAAGSPDKVTNELTVQPS